MNIMANACIIKQAIVLLMVNYGTLQIQPQSTNQKEEETATEQKQRIASFRLCTHFVLILGDSHYH